MSRLARLCWLAAAVGVAACGGNGDDAATTTTTRVTTIDGDDAATTTVEAAPETTEDTASVEQVASAVARHAPTLRDMIAFEDECNSFECIVAQNVYTRWGTIRDAAVAMKGDLLNVHPVPAEVADLTAETMAALDLISAEYNVLTACFALHPGDSAIDRCGAEMNRAGAAWRALPAVLDAWEPYL